MIGRCTHSKEREKGRRKNGADGLGREREREEKERKDDDQTCFCSLPFTKVKVTQLGPFPRQSPLIRRGGTARARLVALHLDPRRVGGDRVAFVVARYMLSAEATDMTEKCRCVASKAAGRLPGGRLSRCDQERGGGGCGPDARHHDRHLPRLACHKCVRTARVVTGTACSQ